MRKGRFIILWAVLALGLFGALTSYGATINVGAGQTIASGIAAAAAGDTVLVAASTRMENIILNKSVTVQANGVVTLSPATAGTGQGIDIQCSNCGVIGIRFVDWGDLDWDYGQNHSNVTLKNCLFRRSGFWGIDGANWLIEGNEFDRPMRGADNTISLFGYGHVIRRNYFHGWVIPADVMDGQHMDHIQFWNNNGEILRDILIEENIFTDYVQAIFIANERAITGSDQPRNITVRNNVFWGTDLTPGPDNLNRPSHTLFMGKGWGTTIGGVANAVITNNIMRYGANQVSMYGMPSSTIVQGNIISEGGADYTLSEGTTNLNRGTIGNISWQSSWHPLGQGPDKFIDPQYQNKNAVGAAVLGPDGIPFTTDDAWRPMNAAAAAYGPQVLTAPPPPPPTPNVAPQANAGPDRVITLAAGQTSTTAQLLGSGADSDGTIMAYRWIGTPDPADVAQPTVTVSGGLVPVSYTFGLFVTDDDGAESIVDTMLLTVNPAPLPPPPAPTTQWSRVRIYSSSGQLAGYRWVQTTAADVRP